MTLVVLMCWCILRFRFGRHQTCVSRLRSNQSPLLLIHSLLARLVPRQRASLGVWADEGERYLASRGSDSGVKYGATKRMSASVFVLVQSVRFVSGEKVSHTMRTDPEARTKPLLALKLFCSKATFYLRLSNVYLRHIKQDDLLYIMMSRDITLMSWKLH